MTRTHVTSEEPRTRQAWRGAGCAGDRARVDEGGRRRHVEEDIVISGVIRNTITAPDDSLLTGHSKEARFPGETNGGTKVFVLIWNLRDGRYGCRGRSTPEWS